MIEDKKADGLRVLTDIRETAMKAAGDPEFVDTSIPQEEAETELGAERKQFE